MRNFSTPLTSITIDGQVIPLSGIDRRGSDFDCRDGVAATSLNLICEDSQMKPLHAPRRIMQLQGAELLLVHAVAGRRNCLLMADNRLMWMPMPTEEGATVHIADDATEIAQLDNLRSIEAMGNAIVAVTDSGMLYFLWRDDGYRALGSKPPFVDLQFGLVRQGSFGNSQVSVNAYITDTGLMDDAENEEKEAVTNAVMGHLLREAADKAVSKGWLYQPFMVRYALRLYDGSYAMHSPPVLMRAADMPHLRVNLDDCYKRPSIITLVGEDINYYGLAWRLDASSFSSSLSPWETIVSGIDVFISAPLYTFNQSGDVERIEADSAGFTGHYADSLGGAYVDHSAGDAERRRWELPANANFYSQLKWCADFYKVASISLEDLKEAGAAFHMIDIASAIGSLDNLPTQPTLPDDFAWHRGMKPNVAWAYNSRLHLANIEMSPPMPFALSTCVEYASEGSDEELTVKVFTRLNGVKCVARRQGCASVATPAYIYYPDASAYMMAAYRGDGSVAFACKLQPHDFLNGAYYIAKYIDKDNVMTPSLPAVPGALWQEEGSVTATSVRLSNRIYASEADNPFSFAATGAAVVGNGDIIGISTAAKALSQGQFGEFPLYAFTTEGIWALSIANNGSIAACCPVARDVCVDARSITQLDSAVLFASARGLMLLSGSKVECVSSALGDEWKAEGSRVVYDYSHQRLIVLGDGATAYVYSLKSGQWGQMSTSAARPVRSYPQAWAMDSDGWVVDFSANDGEALPWQLTTRALKLGNGNALKRVRSVTINGPFAPGEVKTALYGSRDLAHWHLIWSSATSRLRSFLGSPYRYFYLMHNAK